MCSFDSLWLESEPESIMMFSSVRDKLILVVKQQLQQQIQLNLMCQ